MTNDEAIETLRANYPDACYEQLREAVDAAIEALKAQDAAGDTISRQDAIDAMHSLCDCDKENPYRENPHIDAVIDALENLSAVQPEQKIYCSMSGEEFEAWLYNHGICHPDIHESIACDIVPSLIDDAINELPPAQPERKIGHWLLNGERYGVQYYRCSECEEEEEGFNCAYMNYCPNCGARMEVGK